LNKLHLTIASASASASSSTPGDISNNNNNNNTLQNQTSSQHPHQQEIKTHLHMLVQTPYTITLTHTSTATATTTSTLHATTTITSQEACKPTANLLAQTPDNVLINGLSRPRRLLQDADMEVVAAAAAEGAMQMVAIRVGSAGQCCEACMVVKGQRCIYNVFTHQGRNKGVCYLVLAKKEEDEEGDSGLCGLRGGFMVGFGYVEASGRADDGQDGYVVGNGACGSFLSWYHF
jgi:hypothetical protein